MPSMTIPLCQDAAPAWPEAAEAFCPDPALNASLRFEMEPPPLDVISDAEADALIDRLASLDERQRRIRAQADAMCRDIERQRQSVLYAHETDLRAWAMSKLRGNRRTVKRLVGSVSFRTVPGRALIVDPTRALDWCREYLPAAIKETVDPKAVLTGETDADGVPAVPPGVEWVPARETFAVRGVTAAERTDDDE